MFQIAWKDIYTVRCIWELKLRGYCVGNYMHGIMRIGKRVNNKVKNYGLRDLDKETNMKVLNLFMSGWKLAPLRK